MKMLSQLNVDIEQFGNKAIKRLVEAQKNTANSIFDDVKELAPSKTGKYADSIKVSDTDYRGDLISTDVYTDLKSEDGYFIGRMIENGTGIYALEPHIGHTKTFINSNYQYWYVPVKSVDRPIGKKIIIDGEEFYVAHSQPAKPHFYPALQKNISIYKNNIKNALEGAKK